MPFAPVPFAIYPVTPRLSFGSAPTTAADRDALLAAGYTHVLDLRAEQPDGVGASLWLGTPMVYHRDPMVDNGLPQPPPAFVDGVSFVAQALSLPGTRVYIHCHAGQYRSPAMVYAVLRAAGYAPDTAWAMVTFARPDVFPQYLASAEAAVPYLPPIDDWNLFGLDAGTMLGIAMGVGVVGIAAWGLYRALQNRAPARPARRARYRSRS